MGRASRVLVAALSVVVTAGIVALGGLLGGLYWDRVSAAASQTTRAELERLAAEQVPQVFGYDYQTVERSLTDAYNLLTPDYRREFRDRSTTDIIPQARERQVISQANVVGVGVLEARRDTGSVLVFMNRTVTDQSKEPIYDGSRLRVDYQKVDGKWLISYITPI
ncbi:mammalian cell entry protein [[Mycobacterium] burgundiense]|jgi:Mce-associated membrane protein|uniref:Mammalian cell entry protein n=1 Tax=[Mycobacterium] burgundiense TaxID=3064286 RepID=A0ABM9LAQ9_9MYCO|nr:mammalian cell entry protein [Mycolicibacterium sp. MU0053]CAJ1495795.1 mammalian cell entry protein [Mycolicibacterium sp. MU0053]